MKILQVKKIAFFLKIPHWKLVSFLRVFFFFFGFLDVDFPPDTYKQDWSHQVVLYSLEERSCVFACLLVVLMDSRILSYLTIHFTLLKFPLCIPIPLCLSVCLTVRSNFSSFGANPIIKFHNTCAQFAYGCKFVTGVYFGHVNGV